MCIIFIILSGLNRLGLQTGRGGPPPAAGMLRTAKIANDFRREGTTAQPLGVLDFLYRARLVVVHGFVRRLLSCLQGRKVQLLLLGAGLDESFQTKEYRDAGVGIFAVDLPEVIAQRERGSPEHHVNVSFDLNNAGGGGAFASPGGRSF